MSTEYFIWQELERMRRQEQSAGPISLELPSPLPYWEEPSVDAEDSDDAEDEPRRGVIIINMEDWVEIEA
jgi:hypothetical protein